jgi:2-keto-4-pentenoate hydratase/2-oxohepta-3-ene-1,7-dioic acid hydratase in catechol pathway
MEIFREPIEKALHVTPKAPSGRPPFDRLMMFKIIILQRYYNYCAKITLMKTITCNNITITPSKVVCIGRNYVEHIKELNNEMPESMVVFNKPNSAISNTLYFVNDSCRFEAEICFLIKEGEISGVGIGLDLTKADVQKYLKEKGLPWERAKGFDRSAVLSDFVPLEVPIESLSMTLHVNTKLQQHATYDLMIYKPLGMIEEIKSFMHLEDGDIIMSGTPKGVSNYKLGDRFTCKLYSGDEMLLETQWIAQQ